MHATQELSPIHASATEFDSPVADAVCEALRKTGYMQLLDLHVRVDGHNVYLQGCLPIYYLKQIALNVVLGLPEVHTMIDDIDVVN